MDLISNPQELINFMKDIEYKWRDKNGNFHTDMDHTIYETYSLMSPEEVLQYKAGICLDQCEFERDWFLKHNYWHRVMSIQLFRENIHPGHIFLVYKENEKYYWFENAWKEYRGIHEYDTFEYLIADIKHKFMIQNNIQKEELKNLKIEEREKYPYHSSYEEMDQFDTK